ncbi:uncharacterized protein EI90DRAFT_1097989 [Cantharellus anzutake]|uniref:uncharacterized protein n=1 Tax=Cantharellus anzutake TaxID=1750568 RepID=UPI00190793F4|nr:uncharacterized protein EI90DRAFT_1097989 [Cantharellus anzutake]KAF8330801.1 hypothetical protein EI90DRAFT_1097989 [Cantharellus anzutake]
MSSGWIVKLSSSRGMPYFFHEPSRQSRWDAPSSLSRDEIVALPGAKEYLDVVGNPKEAPPAPGQMRASHLLVKHSGSRRPSSWREANITRSKAEAIDILRGYAKEINNSPVKFGELAFKYSDCSSHSKNGDLGWFGPGQMQQPFELGTTALNVGQISDIVDTDSGVHLILRTG